MDDVLLSLWSGFTRHAYALVFLVSLIDATGTPLPGRLLLIAGGALAAAGGASLLAMILLAAGGAVVGDHIWYVGGRFGGRRLLRFYCWLTRTSPEDCANRARRYFERFGGLAILIARFSTAVRIVVTPVAASSGIPYYRYLAFEVAGALLWASIFVTLGYVLGDQGGPALAMHVTLVTLAAAGVWVAILVGRRYWKRAG
ncbi:MAG: DedA family protein [Candidatus Rokuibacteriota bacterium]